MQLTITIELSPEAEASLLPVAQQKGLSLPQYLQKLANDEAQLAETRRRNAIARQKLKQMEQEDAEYWASLTEAEKEADETNFSHPEPTRNRHPDLQKYFMHWQQIGEVIAEERARDETS